MRLLSTRRVPAGARLARDVAAGAPGGAPLLRAGVPLGDRALAALIARGINAVWVEDALSAGIEPVEPVSPETRDAAAAAAAGAFEQAGSALRSHQGLDPVVVSSLSDIAGRIVGDVLACPDAALALTDLADADAYTYRHSVNVAIAGVLLGRTLFTRHGWVDYRGRRRFDRLEERLTLLGTGLLLHDIGKLVVPADVLNKPGALNDEEWALMRSHPDAGVALLPTAGVSPLVHAVLAGHHERCDGSGYPRGLRGEQIHQHARIAAVADVYDAITSARPYRDAAPPAEGVRAIACGGDAFDPEVVEVFRELFVPHPPGTSVTLPDGREGVVVSVERSAPDRPRVRVPLADGPGHEELDVELPLAGDYTRSVSRR